MEATRLSTLSVIEVGSTLRAWSSHSESGQPAHSACRSRGSIPRFRARGHA